MTTETFKPLSPESPHFERIDGFARALFSRGMEDLKAGRIKPSKETRDLLDTLAQCAKNYPHPARSAFIQEAAAILSQVRGGTRS